MTLSNNNCNTVTITSSIITDFLANATPFTKIEFKGTYNDVSKTVTITTAFPDCNSTNAEIRNCSGTIRIYPNLFNQTEKLADGIFRVDIKAYYDDGTISTEFACIFVDCETKCKVVESQCLEAMMYHYVLTESYSCNCACDKLQEIWEALETLLTKNNCNGC